MYPYTDIHTYMQTQAEHHDPNAKFTADAEVSALLAIVGKYKVNDADLQALVEWKHRAF
jgi:hypothetical protein